MAKIKHDEDYEKVTKQYAALLVKVNPKGTDEELAALKERIEARRYGKQPYTESYLNCSIYNAMYQEEIQKEKDELKSKWQKLSADKTVFIEALNEQ